MLMVPVSIQPPVVPKGQRDFPETEELSVDSLVQWVEDLAWSLNSQYFHKFQAVPFSAISNLQSN